LAQNLTTTVSAKDRSDNQSSADRTFVQTAETKN
jgi:hypothetical protein